MAVFDALKEARGKKNTDVCLWHKEKRRQYMMWTALAGAIIPIVLKEGLTGENIEKAAEFLVASGKKLGSKAAVYLEE